MGFAVASGHKLTSEAAEIALRAGGTAVDAVISAALMAFVAEPILAQPLGGGFLLVMPPQGSARLLDGFVQTPKTRVSEAELDIEQITVDFGTTTQDFHVGAGTIAAPCLMTMLFEAHAASGRMPMIELAAPAIEAAQRGVAVTALQSEVTTLVAPILRIDPAVAALHLNDGAPPGPGDLHRNPQLADVLEEGLRDGPRFFSEGEVGQALATLPGTALSPTDIRRARPIWRAPIWCNRGAAKIALNPPPSLGGVQIALALQALPHKPEPQDIATVFAQIVRLRRTHDLDATPSAALDPALAGQLRDLLAATKASQRGTTHISVIDATGQGAALTLSNGEGCGHLLPGMGIMPNNMLGEEDLVPGGPTAWPLDQRLASMMCPTGIRDPDGRLTVLGSGGSARIRSALSTVLIALSDHDLGLAEAIAEPRLHMEEDVLNFECFDDPERHAALIAAAEQTLSWDAPAFYFGGVHIARRTASGAVSAAADPRRDGAALTG